MDDERTLQQVKDAIAQAERVICAILKEIEEDNLYVSQVKIERTGLRGDWRIESIKIVVVV